VTDKEFRMLQAYHEYELKPTIMDASGMSVQVLGKEADKSLIEEAKGGVVCLRCGNKLLVAPGPSGSIGVAPCVTCAEDAANEAETTCADGNETLDDIRRYNEGTPHGPIKQGSWPDGDIRRAFVAGSAWWEFRSFGATMWPSDRNKAEAEAEKRYPVELCPDDAGE